MIRFRFREDERRYYALVSEVYRLLGTHLPPDQVSVAMRNLGKLQDLLMLEGVRQGVAAAAISNVSKELELGDLERLKAFQLHAHIYGSQDTPLRAIEEEWLEKFGVPEGQDGPWLDPTPMRFAPDTERAFAQELAKPQMMTGAELLRQMRDQGVGIEDADIEDIERLLDEEADAQERPDLLDRVRDVLQEMASAGLQPRDWSDLILRLHVQMQVDAVVLDMQLGTPMGQTVLAQAGFVGLQPGPFGMNPSAIEAAAATWVSNPVELPPAAPQVRADGEDEGAPGDGGGDPVGPDPAPTP